MWCCDFCFQSLHWLNVRSRAHWAVWNPWHTGAEWWLHGRQRVPHWEDAGWPRGKADHNPIENHSAVQQRRCSENTSHRSASNSCWKSNQKSEESTTSGTTPFLWLCLGQFTSCGPTAASWPTFRNLFNLRGHIPVAYSTLEYSERMKCHIYSHTVLKVNFGILVLQFIYLVSLYACI